MAINNRGEPVITEILVTKRNYHGRIDPDSHCPYTNVVHDANDDAKYDGRLIDDLLDAVQDGQVVRITVSKIPTKHEHIWALTAPHHYSKVDPKVIRGQSPDSQGLLMAQAFLTAFVVIGLYSAAMAACCVRRGRELGRDVQWSDLHWTHRVYAMASVVVVLASVVWAIRQGVVTGRENRDDEA